MFKIKNLFNKKDDLNKGVSVIYEDGIVRNEILSWCKSLGISNFNDILVKLGFNNDDNIYLYQDYGNLYRVIYSVNENKVNNNNFIWFNYKRNEIVVNNENESKCYNINISNDKDGNVNFDLIYCKKKINDNIFCYSKIEGNNILFVIDNGNYELTLEIYVCCKFYKDEINDLERYLVSLDFPIVIDDVYKNVCNILSLEQSIMEMFNLVVTKNINKRQPDMVMDEILIEKGVLERITKTSDGRSITLDRDGNWSYNKIDDSSILTVKYSINDDPKYKYSYRNSDNDMCGYFSEESLSLLRNDADNEIDNVKKLVKEIF